VNGWVSQSPDPKDNYVLDIFKVIVDPTIDLADARNWPPWAKKTLSGYQRKSLFHNLGGTFKDEAKRHGVDSLEMRAASRSPTSITTAVWTCS